MGIATAVENRYIAQQVRAYQKGDKGAYGKLYSLTKDIVFGYIFPQIPDETDRLYQRGKTHARRRSGGSGLCHRT